MSRHGLTEAIPRDLTYRRPESHSMPLLWRRGRRGTGQNQLVLALIARRGPGLGLPRRVERILLISRL